jgi:phage terminase large subunit-like protein
VQEAQHEVDAPPGGMFDHLEFRHCTWAELPDLVRVVVWVDPAVTSTDQSDSMGIEADGIDAAGIIYRLWSWEQVTSPEDALKRAILKAIELKAGSVGVETDQGGDTWQSVYKQSWQSLIDEDKVPTIKNDDGEEYDPPRYMALPSFRSAKAGSGHGPKAHRASLMLPDYEQARIVHVLGTHQTLERSLKRFPLTKPHDLTDASFWSWNDLRNPKKLDWGFF